jgi:hypothetical protein
MKIKKIFQVIFTILSVILFLFLLLQIDIESIFLFLSKISVLVWILILFLFFLSYFFKALRFKVLNSVSFREIFTATIYHNFFLLIFPFRLGELMYIKKMSDYGTRKLKSLSDILIVRIFDIFIISLVSIIIIFSFGIVESKISLLIILTIFLLSIFFLFFSEYLITNFYKKIGFKNSPLVNKLKDFLNIFRNVKPKKKIKLLLLSLLVWIFAYLPWIVILRLTVNLGIMEMIFAISITLVSTLIPINRMCKEAKVNCKRQLYS